jgi:hypothetical protein
VKVVKEWMMTIKPEHMDMLVAVAKKLESGELIHVAAHLEAPENGFNMADWGGPHHCNTPSCIGGFVHKIYKVDLDRAYEVSEEPGLKDLFFIHSDHLRKEMYRITPQQAAQAIYNYRDHGSPKWEEVLADTQLQISEKLRSALIQVGSDCAMDMDEGGDDPAIVAEVAMDANRLEIWGRVEEQKELDALLDKYSYEEVHAAVTAFMVSR